MLKVYLDSLKVNYCNEYNIINLLTYMPTYKHYMVMVSKISSVQITNNSYSTVTSIVVINIYKKILINPYKCTCHFRQYLFKQIKYKFSIK